jgi:hypothetical protein
VLRGSGGRRRERGQAIVELSLVIPIVIALVVSVGELGFIFGKISSLGYGTREGARSGSALASGEVGLCTSPNQDPSGVDAIVVGTVQRILRSPDSGIDLPDVQQIRIFKATSTGAEIPGTVNIWTYAGPGAGPDVDPGPGTEHIDFTPSSINWWACSRINSGANPDSIGVSVSYTYDFVTPVPVIVDALAGGGLSLTLRETTVMALNPTT